MFRIKQKNLLKSLNLFLKKNFRGDPYYVLGVNKSDSYESIKKHYYKLASQYHPDRNSSPDAAKLFLAIKEAFETIKTLKGQAVKIDSFHKHSEREFKSVRPNPSEYKEDFKDEFMDENGEKMDYKEFVHRTPTGKEFQKFKDSFQEMHDIKDIKFASEHVDLPDPSKRFDIEPKFNLKKKFGDGPSPKFFMVAFVVTFVGIIAANSMIEINRKTMNELIVYNLLNKKQFKDYAASEEKTRAEITANVRENKEYKELKEKMENVSKHQEYIRSRYMPDFKPFVQLSNLQ